MRYFIASGNCIVNYYFTNRLKAGNCLSINWKSRDEYIEFVESRYKFESTFNPPPWSNFVHSITRSRSNRISIGRQSARKQCGWLSRNCFNFLDQTDYAILSNARSFAPTKARYRKIETCASKLFNCVAMMQLRPR